MGLLKAALILVVVYYIFFIYQRITVSLREKSSFVQSWSPYIPMITIFFIELLL